MNAVTKALDLPDNLDHRPTVLLIDGFGLIFRAYHAMPPTITTSTGEQVNAVYGFAAMLLDVLRNERPDYVVIALEGGKTFREEEFADYKANRGATPDDLISQIHRVRQLIGALNIPIEEREGFEADDVIGSLSKRCSDQGDVRVIIMTGDSDMLQLVDDNVNVVLPGTQRFGEVRQYDRAAVEKRYGFGPEFVPDYKALVGDTSDNIPGVPGIGDKTAKNLIAAYGDIESIIAHLPEITPTRARNALDANVDEARRSKRLATIIRDLDIALDTGRSAAADYDREAVIELFRELEFRSLVNKLPEPASTSQARVREKVERPPSIRTIVRTAQQLDHLIARMREVGTYAVDVETDSTDPQAARLVGIAVGVSPHEGSYIPLGHKVGEGEQLDDQEVRERLGPVLADPSLGAYTHHGKYDLAVLARHGYQVGRLAFDTMIAGYLLNYTSLRLKDMAFTLLGIEMTEITALIGTGRNQLTMDQVDGELAGDYAAGDVEATYELAEFLKPDIESQNLGPLLYEIELPLVRVLNELEDVGIAIDVNYLKEFSAEITDRMHELETEIYEVAGKELNINSTRQMATLLFEELGLPSGRKTKTGYSVDSDQLETIRDKHPVVDLVLEYRQLGKLKSTYVDALPEQVAADGRVHTSYNQTVAQTGRLSSTNPNLQNIPIRTEQGRRVRRAFVADHRPEYRLFPDSVLLSADYSQIELRLLAHLSGEPFLVDAYNSWTDIHRATAATVYGIPPDEVTSAMRSVAKTVNFGVLYGMQAFGLSRDTGLSRAESQKFIDSYWERLPRVREYFAEVLRVGAAQGAVKSESGRRRPLPDLTSSNGQRRQAAERMAMNMPIQGGAADIMKIAMLHLSDALRESPLKAKVLLQVHDELVLEVDRSDLEPAARLLKDTMENAVKLSVPVAVEVGYGDNWDDMTDLVLE